MKAQGKLFDVEDVQQAARQVAVPGACYVQAAADVGADELDDCIYFSEKGEPVCLVGQVLYQLDITPEKLMPMFKSDPWYSGSPLEGHVVRRIEPLHSLFTERAIDYLAQAQDLQDHEPEREWSEILDFCDEGFRPDLLGLHR